MHRVVQPAFGQQSDRVAVQPQPSARRLRSVLRCETALYTSLLFERGSQQKLHRDSPLFVTRPEGCYLGVWAALEDTDGENGPLLVVPGSHRLPPLDLHAMASELYGEP